MKLNNPFLDEGYAGAEYFCDRKVESADLASHLYNDRNVTLYSPRRMGKSGLIKHVFAQTGKSTARCYYIDIMNTWCLKDFINRFASVIMGSMDSRKEAFVKNAVNVLGNLRPTFSVSAVTGEPSISLDIAQGCESSTLETIFSYIRSKEDTRVYIAIDEFQQIATYPEKGVDALLRSYTQFTPNATFIFSGSRRHLLYELFNDPKSPFFASTTPMSIGEIDRGAYCAFAKEKFKEDGRILPDDVFFKLYDTVYGHTWYVQEWLNYLFSENTSRTITESDLMNALGRILRFHSESFIMRTQSLTKAERRIVEAIAREGKVVHPQSASFIGRYSLGGASTVSACLRRLVDREIIYAYDGEYTVYDKFYAIWMSSS